MEGQGHRGPLVLLDAAIVMGLEVGDFTLLIQGHRLQVQTGGIRMGDDHAGTLVQGLLADDHKGYSLFAVDAVDLISGAQLHLRVELHKTGGTGGLHGHFHGFPLRLGPVHELHVVLAVDVQFLFVLVIETSLLGVVQQRLADSFPVHFRHYSSS